MIGQGLPELTPVEIVGCEVSEAGSPQALDYGQFTYQWKTDTIIVRVNCNEKAMRFWALQYGPYIEVLEPESLRNQIKESIAGMSKKYSDE